MKPKNIIVMKVGPHSGMSLDEIIISKRDEEATHGVHYWGYSGSFCQPGPVQAFCEQCFRNDHVAPSLILIETKSSYKTDKIGFIQTYSTDGKLFTAFRNPVQLQGAQFAFVAKSLHTLNDFCLDDYIVKNGKNEGNPLSTHLRYRVGKSFAQLNQGASYRDDKIEVLEAELAPPYAIWLRES